MDTKIIKKIVRDAVEQRLKVYPEAFQVIVKEPFTDMVADMAEDAINDTDVGLMTYLGDILNHPIDIIKMDGDDVIGIFDGNPSIETLITCAKIRG